MPFFSNFGTKKKSKSSLNLSGAAQRRDQWGEDGRAGSSYSLDRGGGQLQSQDQKVLAKLERINTDLEDRNVNLEEENNMLKIKVEILLDMLAQKTAETDFQEKELERLRSALENLAPSRLALI